MVEISIEAIKELRQRTGAGIADCRRALADSGGDLEKALEHLRKRGIEIAEKKAHRKAAEGIIYAYIHPPGKVGALIELNSETDFVARNEKFQTLAKDLAMHITAMAPKYLSREDVPPAEIERQKAMVIEQAKGEGKSAEAIESLIASKLDRFFAEKCLLDQPFIREPEKTVKQIIQEHIAIMGENLVLRRFVRFGVGESEEG